MDRSEYFDEPDALVTAVLFSDFEAAQLLVAKGVDINAKNEMGDTALIMAIEEDWVGTRWIEFLLENGANVNLTDTEGDTPLDIAKYQKREDICTILLGHGAIGKDEPSAKEVRDDQVYDAFQHANAVKNLNSLINKKKL